MTVAVAEVAAMEKSKPVPVSDTVCGLPAALSVIVRVPVLEPPTVGSKKTPMEQLEPTDKLLPHELSGPKSEGLAVTLAMIRGAAPVFISVTVCGRLLVPTYWFGNMMLEGEMLVIGTRPVPVSVTDCGLPDALSVMVRDAVRVPVAVGLKVILMEQLELAATLVPQVFV